MQMEKLKMRRNFVDILNSAKINYKNEYNKLYQIMYVNEYPLNSFGKSTLHEYLDSIFSRFWFAKTYLSLTEFDTINGFDFPDSNQQDITFDDLILIIEYFMNMMIGYKNIKYSVLTTRLLVDEDFIIQHLHRVTDAIGYKVVSRDGLSVLVEKDAVVTAVAESELIPEEISYRLITYNHHSMRGNLEDKKAIILQLANLLEGKQAKLSRVNSSLKNDLFYLFNNFNIRHNNCDRQSKDYKPGIASMDKQELENWYDETYQMCLLAFMELEQADRKPKFDAIKTEIEKK